MGKFNPKTGTKEGTGAAGVGWPWLAVATDFLRSERCVSLSPHGAKLLLDALSFIDPKGGRNGDLSFAPSDMRHRGWTSRSTLGAAITELMDAGLLVVTRQGSKRHAYLYALTLYKVDQNKNVTRKLDADCRCLYLADDKTSWGPMVNSKNPATWNRARKRSEKTQSVSPQRDEGCEISPAAGREDTAKA